MISKRELWLGILILQIYKISCDIVQTNSGQVNGTIIQSWTGQNFHAFYAIPYAQPPIGELRFKPPLPVESWDGVRPATEYGYICWQVWQENIPEMNEDCLTLNVFTKNLPSNNATELKPVVVFIHGGGFITGSSYEAGPLYLMDGDIVYVTANYRLNAFGFLATGSREAPGNMGMKDLVMALKWVKENIQHFGGNPNKVTLSGMSAGAHAIECLMTSPMAENLFHGVIAHSSFNQRGFADNYLNFAIFIAKEVGCTSENPDEFVACLRTKPAEDIANVTLTDAPYCSTIRSRPVIEPDFEQERFLTEDPIESFRNGRFSKVPVIAGITANEYVRPVLAALQDNNLKQLNENFHGVGPNCFAYSLADNTTTLGNALRKAYLPFDTIDVRSFNNLNYLFSDGLVGIGVHRFVHFISNVTDVYYYKFSFISPYSLFVYPYDRPYGVHHGDDMQYIISGYVSHLYQKSDPESFMVERITKIYEQFAWYGNPNNATDEYLSEMNWPKHDSVNEFYMDIGTFFVEKNGLNLERYTVWDQLETGAANTNKSKLTAVLAVIAIFIKL